MYQTNSNIFRHNCIVKLFVYLGMCCFSCTGYSDGSGYGGFGSFEDIVMTDDQNLAQREQLIRESNQQYYMELKRHRNREKRKRRAIEGKSDEIARRRIARGLFDREETKKICDMIDQDCKEMQEKLTQISLTDMNNEEVIQSLIEIVSFLKKYDVTFQNDGTLFLYLRSGLLDIQGRYNELKSSLENGNSENITENETRVAVLDSEIETRLSNMKWESDKIKQTLDLLNLGIKKCYTHISKFKDFINQQDPTLRETQDILEKTLEAKRSKLISKFEKGLRQTNPDIYLELIEARESGKSNTNEPDTNTKISQEQLKQNELKYTELNQKLEKIENQLIKLDQKYKQIDELLKTGKIDRKAHNRKYDQWVVKYNQLIAIRDKIKEQKQIIENPDQKILDQNREGGLVRGYKRQRYKQQPTLESHELDYDSGKKLKHGILKQNKNLIHEICLIEWMLYSNTFLRFKGNEDQTFYGNDNMLPVSLLNNNSWEQVLREKSSAAKKLLDLYYEGSLDIVYAELDYESEERSSFTIFHIPKWIPVIEKRTVTMIEDDSVDNSDSTCIIDWRYELWGNQWGFWRDSAIRSSKDTWNYDYLVDKYLIIPDDMKNPICKIIR